MSNSILSHRGYSISKKGTSTSVLSHYRKELTIMPFVEREEYAFAIKPIKLYTETSKRFYMPRYYGVKQLGEPTKNKLNDQQPTKINVPIIYEPKENQKPIVKKIINDLKSVGGGVMSAYCGFGKTFCALHVASKMSVKTMIICHTTSLMQQWVERIGQFMPTARIGIVQQSMAEVEGVDIIIASLKTLALKDFGKGYFSSVGLVVWDEIHLMCTNTFSKAFPKCASRYNIGLSATPYRKDRCDIIFQYFIGPVLYMLKREKDSAIVAQCITLLVPEDEIVMKYDRRGKVMYSSSLSNVLYNPKRTFRIVEMIVDHARKGRKILVLGEYIKHLKDIMKQLIKRETEIHDSVVDEKMKKNRKNLERFMPLAPMIVKNMILKYVRDSLSGLAFSYGLYIGEMNNDARKQSETKDVILGTYKLASVGMDIPHLNTLLMASPRKEIEQSVGRILRKKAGEYEHKPLIIDIIDNHGIFVNQSRTRKKFYKEYGYTMEHIRMEPISGKITSKRVVNTSAPKVDIKKSKQLTLKSFQTVPCVSLSSTKNKKHKKGKEWNEDNMDECLLDSCED